VNVDLVLRGGTLCDGSGLPALTGDLVIQSGRILGLGRYDGPARRVIDVSGLVVAPGFVDVHTHYDAQVTWDGLLTPSCWHGVTTAVIGNCGFGLAPCRPAERERVLRMLEHVEGMPYASLAAGVVWDWETAPEYLAMLGARPLGPNVAALLGHSTIRAYVMGDDAYERPAREDEIERMAAIVREGMAAGALGLATSFSPGHVGEGGRPVPSRSAGRAELAGLVAAMAEGGRGVVEITPESFPIAAEELSFLADLARSSRRPVSFSAVLDVPGRDGVWDPVFAGLRTHRAAGARIHPQVCVGRCVSTRPRDRLRR
jgi:N-acyl-D-aspartate/D-glutamate deacylase